MPYRMTRSAYAQMFGPTVGDKVRLADTDLIIEVDKDFTIYGEDKFSGCDGEESDEFMLILRAGILPPLSPGTPGERGRG